jgi:flagellar basal-body rod protein FlgC
MSLFKIFDIAGSGMVAQSQRLNVVASNLANAESVAGPDGKPYKAREVVFQTSMVGNLNAPSLSLTPAAPAAPAGPALITNANSGYVISSNPDAGGVRVAGVVESSAPGRRVYDPQHPMADENGYVNMPNVNVVDEMVNMISASRSYQTNTEVMNTAKNMLMHTLQIGS